MDMEEASGAAQGDLADVVARANAMAAASSAFTHHHHPPPPPASPQYMSHRYPAAAAGDHIMVVQAYDERQPTTVVGDAAMFDAPSSSTVVDPYHLSSPPGYGLPHHHQQPAAVQISQHACCGGRGVVDAMMTISPLTPPAHHHQVIKRKNEVRKVVCIPAPPPTRGRAGGGGGEAVIPSDLWAWRKYGQKPIKGSPYPRGYYRCSSSKGCLARKQVERSRSDPNMLVITYTAEHNHPWPMQRNVLAGYARAHTHASASATKKHAQQHKTSNVATSSSNNNFHHSYSVHPEQDVIGSVDDAANTMAVSAAAGIEEAGGVMMYERVVQPDEVFAELEELEADNNSMDVNANISRGVSQGWHKF